MASEEIGHGYFSKDIEELLAVFSTHRVEFLVVGGEAVILRKNKRASGRPKDLQDLQFLDS